MALTAVPKEEFQQFLIKSPRFLTEDVPQGDGDVICQYKDRTGVKAQWLKKRAELGPEHDKFAIEKLPTIL